MRAVLLLGMLLPAALFAQPPRGFFAWWDTPVVRDLNLSDDQTRQIRTIVKDYRARLIDHRAAVEKAEGEVQDLFNEETVDASDAIERLVQARGELTRSFTLMSVKLRAVLTAGQWRELQRRRPLLPQRVPGMGGPMRRGPMGVNPPGGPGPPGQPRPPIEEKDL
jgi:hypothetical protein